MRANGSLTNCFVWSPETYSAPVGYNTNKQHLLLQFNAMQICQLRLVLLLSRYVNRFSILFLTSALAGYKT